MTDTDKLRADFEAWVRASTDYDLEMGIYKASAIDAWHGYQAGYASRDAEVAALRQAIDLARAKEGS